MAKTVTRRKRIKTGNKTKRKGQAKRMALPKLINLTTAAEMLTRVEDDAKKVLQDIINRSKKAQKEGTKKIEKIIQQARKNGYLRSLQSSKQWKYVESLVKDLSKTSIFSKVKQSDLRDQLVLRIRRIQSGRQKATKSGKEMATNMKKFVGDKILVGLYEIEAALKIPTAKDFQKLSNKVQKLESEVNKIAKPAKKPAA